MYKSNLSRVSIMVSITILSVILLFSFSCKNTPKNACEISEEDAKVFLENGKLFPSDKSKLSAEEGKNSQNIRGCSFTPDEHIDVPSLRWTNIEFDNEKQAQENFNLVKGINRTGSSKSEISGIGNEAFLIQEEYLGKKISLSVRKGKNVFSVIIHLENLSEKAVENVKMLAKKIADKT